MIIFNRILLMLGLFACSLTHGKQQNQYFEVLQVTSQEWTAGVRGGGRGINYKLSIKIKTNKKVAFDSIWVSGKKLNLKQEKSGQNEETKLAKNSSVTLFASDYRGGPGKNGRKEEEKISASSEDSAKAPMEYKGAALVKYFVDGSARYVVISNITVLPSIYGH